MQGAEHENGWADTLHLSKFSWVISLPLADHFIISKRENYDSHRSRNGVALATSIIFKALTADRMAIHLRIFRKLRHNRTSVSDQDFASQSSWRPSAHHGHSQKLGPVLQKDHVGRYFRATALQKDAQHILQSSFTDLPWGFTLTPGQKLLFSGLHAVIEVRVMVRAVVKFSRTAQGFC